MRLLALAASAALVAACAGSPSRKDRQSAEIHHDLGVDALKNGRAAEALQEFEEALRLDPRFPGAHLGRGLVLEFAYGKLPEAEREYRQAISLKPSYPDARNNLGQLLAKTGRWEEALREFDAALADMTYREPYVARCNKGQALHAMGRKDEGIAELKACLAVAPRYCAGRRELGRIYLQSGRTPEALEELAAYARACEKVPDAQYQLGLAHMKAGDDAAAREAFQRCEELGPATAVGDECRRSRELLQ